MKILITGSSGFIGFSLTSKLLSSKHRIIGVDDMNDHYDVMMKIKRLEELKKKHRNYEFVKLDIRNFKALDRLFAKHKFTHIINLAARAGVRNSLTNPWIYYQTNTIGFLNILELMRKYGIKHLVQASTSSVYGDNKVPFSEDDFTDHPFSPYAASKKATESLGYSYHYLYGLNIAIPRFFTVYGPFGRPDMSVFRFIKWIDEGRALEVYGDGNQMRDFTYVDDIVAGIIKAAALKGYHIINLGNNNPTRLIKVIRLLEKYLGKKARIKYLPPASADIYKTCASIGKANRLLRWKPQVRIEEGLKKAVDWYLQNKDWVGKVKIS